MYMNKIEIRTIPAHIVYTAEYDQNGIGDFFDPAEDKNLLYDLQYLMEDENHDVKVPDLGDDYNYFEYPLGDNEDGSKHIIYHDMVDKKGRDNADGIYRFEEMPEVRAAVMEYMGYYDTLDKGFEILYKWIEENGYIVAGKCRISAINGSWDTENPDEYVNELQVPICKA